MIEIKIDGIEELTAMRGRVEQLLSPASLTARVMSIAEEAGVILHLAAVSACIEAVYNNPVSPGYPKANGEIPSGGGFPDSARSGDLVDAHVLISDGLSQSVVIDPDMSVSSNSHPGREKVIDYAIPVHEGYTQWLPHRNGESTNTGIFHPGRFWLEVAAIETAPVILEYVKAAYEEVVTQIITEIAS